MSRQWQARTLVAIAFISTVALGGMQATVAGQTPTSGDAPTTPTAERVVDIRYLRYTPDPIEITTGETIHWTNHDALPHTVTSAGSSLLASETLLLGDVYRQTFSAPGTYDYICLYHKQMHGTVIVQEG